MKAVGIKGGHGPSEALFIEDNVPVPQLKPGQALVQVKAFGLNRMDLSQRGKFYPLPPGASPILGVEFAGIIKEIHPDATENVHDGTGKPFKVGDKVFGLVSGGGYAEQVATPLATLLHLPEELSYVEGAAIPEVWFTAYQVVEAVGGLQNGGSLLFHAGASGVGIAAIQIAQILGAKRIFTTVGSDDKKEFVKNKLLLKGNPDDLIVPINYRSEDFVEVIKKIQPAGVDVIIDPVGQSYFTKDISLAAKDGTIVIMGTMSGTVVEDKVDILPILYNRIKVVGTTLRSRALEYQSELRNFIATDLLPKIINKELNIFVEKEFEFHEIVEAHKALESNNTMGKLIVRID